MNQFNNVMITFGVIVLKMAGMYNNSEEVSVEMVALNNVFVVF